MILAYVVNDHNNEGMGSYRFDALPRIGDHIVLQDGQKERYVVADVEHWPIADDHTPIDPSPCDNTFVRVQHVATIG